MDIRLNSNGTWNEIGGSGDGGGGCLVILLLLLLASTGAFKRCACSGCGPNHIGYPSEQYLQQSVNGHAIVKVNIANIRTGPGTNYGFYINARGEKVQLRKNTQVNILEDVGSWFKIRMEDGGTGYINKSLCADSNQKEDYSHETPEKENPPADFEPVIYDNNNGFCSIWQHLSKNNRLDILKIEHQYNKTVFYFNFNAVHAESWIRFDKGCYALCYGHKYMMTSPTTTIRNPTTNAKTGTDNYFTLEFEAIPTDWDEINLGFNDKLFYSNIRHY